jgi:hypothetical protein
MVASGTYFCFSRFSFFPPSSTSKLVMLTRDAVTTPTRLQRVKILSF